MLLIFCFVLENCQTLVFASKEVDEEKIKNDLLEEIETQLDRLNMQELDDFVKSVEQNIGVLFNSPVKELMKKIIKGEFITDFDSFMNFIFSSFSNILKKYLPFIVLIVFIAILSGTIGGLTSGFIKKQTTDIINLVCYFAIIIVIFTSMGYVLNDVKKTILIMQKLMEITFPIMLTLLVAMGGVVSGNLYKPMMLVLSNIVVEIIIKVIIPFFIAGIVLSVACNMTNSVKFTKLPKFFSTCSSWILGSIFSIFTIFISLKGLTGVMVDSVSISATKFCLSSYVPIVGGYVSDGFDLVLASCMLIKNSFGITVLIIMLLTVIVPIFRVVLFMMSLKLIEAVVEPIADNKICKMLDLLCSNLTMLVSCLVALGFMLFILMMLIIGTFRF